MHRKTIYSFLLFLFVMLSQRIAFSQEASFLSKSGAAVAITAGEHCQFLNAVAATDPDHLYEEKMGSSHLILRTGEVGSYHYQVVAGREEAPIIFMSKLHASYYLSWLQDPSLVLVSTIPAMACDEELQVMNSPFYLVKDSSLTFMQQSSDQEERSFLENVMIRAAGIGVLLVAGREMIIRGIPTERADPLSAYFPERLQESNSTQMEEEQPMMNIIRSKSSSCVEASDGISPFQKGSISWIFSRDKTPPSEGKPIVPLDWKLLKKFPQNILREAVFFSPAMPGNHYKQEYNNALVILQLTNPILAKQIDSWKGAYDQWLSAPREQKRTVYQELQHLETNLPREGYVVTAFYRAEKIIRQFHFFQEKYLHALEAQEEKLANKSVDGPIPYLLSEASKVNDILAQATSNIEALIDVVQICQQESKKEENKGEYFIVKQYEKVLTFASKAISGYAPLVETIETKDVAAIRLFLEEREQQQAMTTAKKGICSSLWDYHISRLIYYCRESLPNNRYDKNAIDNMIVNIRTSFCSAIDATSYWAQRLLEKAEDYYLQEIEERAASNRTIKATNLHRAAFVVKQGSDHLKDAQQVRTDRGSAAYHKALEYYLQAGEEIATKGLTPKAMGLKKIAAVAANAGGCFEEAEGSLPQFKETFKDAAELWWQDVRKFEKAQRWQESFKNYRQCYGVGI